MEQRKKILVAEDNSGVRKLLESMFKNDYTVKAVCNGKEALYEIEREIPDMLISDIEMPEMSGVELIENIRFGENYKDKYKNLKIVLMSTNPDKYKSELEKHKDIKIFNKPFEFREFTAFVKNYIDNKH